MKYYFNLLLVMTNRKIREAGLNPVLGYLFGLTACILLTEYAFQKTVFAKYLVILIGLNFQLKLSEKNRTDFLLLTFGDKITTTIRICENLIMAVPFVSMLIYKRFIFEASMLFLCSIILALFSIQSNITLKIPTPFSKRPFEFSTGFRKTFFIFPLAYVLTVIAVYVDNLNLGIFALSLIFLTTLSYYAKPEHEYYVWVHAATPKMFLKNKILNASKNATFLTAPILITLLTFYTAELELVVVFFIIGHLFLWTIILAKYAAYPAEMNLPEGVVIAFSLYFPPLLLAIIPFFYIKSINKLKFLLNDTNQ